jgi:hypothetical protein
MTFLGSTHVGAITEDLVFSGLHVTFISARAGVCISYKKCMYMNHIKHTNV